MDALFSNLRDFLDSRIKNIFFINFIFSWLIVNYDISMTIILKEMPIDNKIAYIQGLQFNLNMWLLLPLAVTLFYIYLLPLINLLIIKVYDKIVHKFIKKYEHNKQLDNFANKREIEVAKHNAVTFVERDLELEKQKQENLERAESVKLKEQENIAKEHELELIKKLEEEKALISKDEKKQYEQKLEEVTKRMSTIYDTLHEDKSKTIEQLKEELDSIFRIGDLRFSNTYSIDMKNLMPNSSILNKVTSVASKLQPLTRLNPTYNSSDKL